MSNELWKENLEPLIPENLAREIDLFEAQISLRKLGKIDEKVFAETRLRRLGVRRGALFSSIRPGHGWESLTPIEVRIASLVAEGRSNPDIAAELSLPRRTVQAHVARLLGKLDTPSRSGVADAFRRRP